VVADGNLLAAREIDATQNHAALLPVMARDVMHEAAVSTASLGAIATTVGPGSFTGIRAALALAHGIALAAAIPVVGVTVGEALADSLPALGVRELWVAIDSRRGRVFLERGAGSMSLHLDHLPCPAGKIAVAGDAAPAVASRLAALDADVMLTDARLPMARHVAVVAERRLAGDLGPLPALPLYVDAPEARLPVGGLRPSPAG
jgi:tRNA threonylcarbamoyl adenosine modification protein YeaZ